MSVQIARPDWPSATDFAPPPTPTQRAAWEDADREARPARLARLRARFADAGVDAYFGARPEHMRYLTGFTLAEGEEKGAGQSGQFLVTADEVVVLADSRYTIQAHEEAPEARVEQCGYDLPARWPELLAGLRPGGGTTLVTMGFAFSIKCAHSSRLRATISSGSRSSGSTTTRRSAWSRASLCNKPRASKSRLAASLWDKPLSCAAY